MGIKERQERDKEAVKRSILDAARDLFVSEGFQNVSIRKIAEKIEYSPAAIYGYFPSKDDIFLSLAEEGFRLLHAHPTDKTPIDTLEPLERVRAMFWRLYEFSCEHPEYFTLMFLDGSVPRINREYERFAFARELKAEIVEQIHYCIDRGVFPKTVPALVAVRVLTAGLLGVALLKLSNRLADGENPDDLAHDVLNVTIAGLQSGVAIRSTAVGCPLEPDTPQS